jgi:hypothetical protein
MQTEIIMDEIRTWHRVIFSKENEVQFADWARGRPAMEWAGWFIPRGNFKFIGVYIKGADDAMLAKLMWT